MSWKALLLCDPVVWESGGCGVRACRAVIGRPEVVRAGPLKNVGRKPMASPPPSDSTAMASRDGAASHSRASSLRVDSLGLADRMALLSPPPALAKDSCRPNAHASFKSGDTIALAAAATNSAVLAAVSCSSAFLHNSSIDGEGASSSHSIAVRSFNTVSHLPTSAHALAAAEYAAGGADAPATRRAFRSPNAFCHCPALPHDRIVATSVEASGSFPAS
mmetsp:Transcript_72397/g.172525  ORF Transcript_72397/g.172525 Transcript_72397/m.172525 type:complete len:219 (-) Transcript_72397:311-967(-)